jgi:hypothetical protein
MEFAIGIVAGALLLALLATVASGGQPLRWAGDVAYRLVDLVQRLV